MTLKFEFHPRWADLKRYLFGEGDTPAEPDELVRQLENRERKLEEFLNNLGGGSGANGAVVLCKIYQGGGTIVPTSGSVDASLTIDIDPALDTGKVYKAVMQSVVTGTVSSGSGPKTLYFVAGHHHRPHGGGVYTDLSPGAKVAITDQADSTAFVSQTGITVPILNRFTVLPGDSIDLVTNANLGTGFVYDPALVYSLSIAIFTIVTVYQLDSAAA